jgi:hypothetical protein
MTAKKPSRKGPEKLPHQLIVWTRSTGLLGQVLGWATLVFANYFWLAVSAIYIGFAVLMADAFLEPALDRRWKIPAVIAIILGAATFTYKVVMPDAPLGFLASTMSENIPAGSEMFGITWRPEFASVMLRIANPTDNDYDNLNVVILPSDPIAHITQISAIPNCFFQDKNSYNITMTVTSPTDNYTRRLPAILLATDSGYRLVCQKLAAHSTIEISIALANIKTEAIERSETQSDFVLDSKLVGDNTTHYWVGLREGDVYARKPQPSMVALRGTYRSSLREWKINENIKIYSINPGFSPTGQPDIKVQQ